MKTIIILMCLLMTNFAALCQSVGNAGLESGNAAPWTAWNPSGTSAVVASNARTGTYAVQQTGPETGFEQVVTGLSPNTAYTLEAWLKVSTIGHVAKLGVKNYGAGDVLAVATETVYRKTTVNFKTGASSTQATIYMYKNNIGTAYGDDFKIYKTVDLSANGTLLLQPDTVSLIRNPAMGWTLYDDASGGVANAANYWAALDQAARQHASNLYIRWRWTDMEPQEGHYAWMYDNNFKALIQGAKDRGLKLCFRIYMDGKDNLYQATPDFVRLAGAQGYMSKGSVDSNWTPYADDPVFQAKFANFVHAFADEFDDPEVVDFIDGYNLGWWGEGNYVTYKNPANATAVLNWIVNLYSTSFQKILLVINLGASTAGRDYVHQFVLEQNGYIMRFDAMGSQWLSTDRKNYLKSIFPGIGFIAESCYWSCNTDDCKPWRTWSNPPDNLYNSSSTWKDVYTNTYNQSIAANANCLDLREAVETSGWLSRVPELVQAFKINGGYRLYPSQVSLPAKISLGTSFKIGHQWKNMGVGVCPNNNMRWNNKYKAAFALIEPGTGTVKKILTDANANPANWLKTSYNNYVLDATVENIPPGNYYFAVAIINTENNKPGLNIALENPTVINKWIKLSEVTVETPQQLPALVTTGANFSLVQMSNTNNATMQLPPWVIAGGWRQYFASGKWTKTLSSPASLAEPTSNIDFSQNASYGPVVQSPLNWSEGYLNPTSLPAGSNWKRQSSSIYSVERYNHSTQGLINLAFGQGENKNERPVQNGYLYSNTFDASYPSVLATPSTYSGYAPGGSYYVESWRAYHATVNVSWLANTAATNWGNQYYTELGPIVWPTGGYYRADGSKASNGVSNPTSIVKGDSIYVFYIDGSGDTLAFGESGGGIKVARAHKNDALNPLKWYVYYNGAWNASLPPGFTSANLLNYTKTRGARASTLLYEFQTTPYRFAVAKISNSNLYMGARAFFNYKQSSTQPTICIGLSVSSDLINWGPENVLVQSASWNTANLRFPIFLNKNGNTNGQIDVDDFYIIGASAQEGNLGRLRVHLSVDSSQIVPLMAGAVMPAPQALSKVLKNEETGFGAYPNPVKVGSILTTVFNSSIGGTATFNISNMKGQQIISEKIVLVKGMNKIERKVPQVAAGMYVVKIADKAEKKTVSIIIQ
jgi:hypothetical protein